jgi:hypothetical protein
MTITEMLQQIANLSVGLDNATEFDNEINLRYLNLAHAELYRSTAAVNPDATIVQKTIAVDQGALQEKINAFTVKNLHIPIANNTKVLQPIPYDWVLQHDPARTQAGQPIYWYRLNHKLFTYPKYTGDIQVVYIGQAIPFTLETEEADIPYPPLYHSVLVDGACYYAFQGESGLKNREEMLLTLTRWEQGKKSCSQYLINQSNYGVISTYSEL